MKKIGLAISLVLTTFIIFGCSKSQDNSKSKYIELGDYKTFTVKDNANITVTDNEITNTICSDILYSVDDIKVNDKDIKKDSYVSLSLTNNGITDVVSGLVSTIDINSEAKEELMSHKRKDKFEVKTSDGTISVEVTEVLENPLNYFSDNWVETQDKGVATTDEYKDYVRYLLEQDKISENKNELLTSIYNEIMSRSKVIEYPEESVEKEIEVIELQYDYILQYYDTDMKDTILQELNSTDDKVYEKYIEDKTKETVYKKLICSVIAEKEDIDIDYEKEIKEYEETHTMPYDSVEALGYEYVKELILEETVENWLLKQID